MRMTRRGSMAAVTMGIAAMLATGNPATAEEGDPIASMTASQSRLLVDLLGAVAGGGDSNAVVSPSGLAAVLGELEMGADKTMAAAISKTLRLDPRRTGEAAMVRQAMRLLQTATGGSGPLVSADAIFVSKEMELKPGIADRARAEGGADVRSVDFSGPAGVEAVNTWVSDKTAGRITAILDPGTTAELVVANALYFKDKWRSVFNPAETAPASFTRIDGSKAETPMMHLHSDALKVTVSGRFLIAELPYADSRFAMRLMTTTDKPAKPDEFDKALPAFQGTLPARRVDLALPKFALTGSQSLLEPLSALGLKPGLASPTQLSGFADKLKLSLIRQKAMIIVDEAGTEAAAATAAVATRGGSADGPVDAQFDKPFVFALRHVPTGVIVAGGYVADPSVLQSPAK